MAALSRVGLVLLLLGLMAPGAQAQQSAAELKAQVLTKVLRFVEWPAGALVEAQDLQLCLTDDGPLAQQLLQLDGQMLPGHRLRVRARAPRNLAGCHAALVGAGAVLPVVPGVLLVAEEALRADNGPMLSLQVEDGRVVFDVDLEGARRAGIGFSARLLRLARYVRKT